MKSYSFLSPPEFLVVLVTETLHVVGTAILFLIALPQLDAARGIMATNAVALVPGILKLATEMKPLMISEEQNSVSLKRSIMNSTKIHESGECIYLFNQ